MGQNKAYKGLISVTGWHLRLCVKRCSVTVRLWAQPAAPAV